MIESVLSRAEYGLSYGARIPILGSIPAALKILMGAIQLAVALLFAILSAPIAACGNQTVKNFFARSLSHVIHGFANIIAGIIETIPILGTLLFVARSAEEESKGFALILRDKKGNYYPFNEKKKDQEGVISIVVTFTNVQVGKWVAYRELMDSSIIHCKRNEAKHTKNNQVIFYEAPFEESFSFDEAKRRNIDFRKLEHHWLLV